MTYEEIEKLDKIISKRLGKKANALWRDAKNDLFVANIIKNNIIKVVKYEKKPIKEYYNYEMYVDYIAKKLKEEDKAFIMKWLKENIDKESLKKWLDENESPKDDADKTLTIPKETLDKAIDIYFKNKNYTIEKVPIIQLVEDNYLLNDDDLESYHQRTWNNAKAKDLFIDENKLNEMSVGDVPYAIKSNGKLIIVDGRHRIRGAWNDGYKFIEMPVINDEDETK